MRILHLFQFSEASTSRPVNGHKDDDDESSFDPQKEEEFEALFAKFANFRDSSANMPDEERKAYAEKVAMSFWNALGGDDEGEDSEQASRKPKISNNHALISLIRFFLRKKKARSLFRMWLSLRWAMGPKVRSTSSQANDQGPFYSYNKYQVNYHVLNVAR